MRVAQRQPSRSPGSSSRPPDRSDGPTEAVPAIGADGEEREDQGEPQAVPATGGPLSCEFELGSCEGEVLLDRIDWKEQTMTDLRARFRLEHSLA